MSDKLVQELQSTIDRLEKRLADVESRLHGGSSAPSSQAGGSDGMRMILIGPPGAGRQPHDARA